VHHITKAETKVARTLRVSMTGICKYFPGVIANEDVDVEFLPSEIHALLGENGAGKSTLMKMLCGIYQPDAGRIALEGEPVRFAGPQHSIAAGIGMVHQHFHLVNAFTVAENLHLGWDDTPRIISRKKLFSRAMALSKKYNLDVPADAYVHQLSAGEQQRVEILKMLTRGAKVLILDEPTAMLTPDESRHLFKNLRRLASDGHTVIIISHKLKEVLAYTDRITVLRSGRKVNSARTANCNEEMLANQMVGRSLVFGDYRRTAWLSEKNKVAELVNVCANNDRGLPALVDVSLHVKSGEIVGVSGVAGNGQRELSEVLSGLRNTTLGKVVLNGVDVTNKPSRHFLEQGLGFVPEDRLRTGLAATRSIAANVALREYKRPPLGWRGLFSPGHAKRFAIDLLKSAGVAAPNINTSVGNLSGGNQQRMIMHRELRVAEKIMIAVYPTRGLDVAAIEDIRKILIDRRNEGVGILLISEELEEIFAVCDRIAVLFRGRIIGVIDRDKCDLPQIGRLMGGVTAEAPF
jgi:general nucleoside transport system ATP-binding protein